MKRTILAASVAIALSSNAYAGGHHKQEHHPLSQSAAVAVAQAKASSKSASSASALGGSATINNDADAPSISLSTPISTAPCRVAIGGGGSGTGFGLVINGSVLDEGCDVWRDAQNLAAIGAMDAAIRRACDKPEVARALRAVCDSVGHDGGVPTSAWKASTNLGGIGG